VLTSNEERALIFSYNSKFFLVEHKFSYPLAFGLCKKRLFSSKSDLENNTNKSSYGVVSQPSGTVFSLSSISKLGLKTYENPQESRELIRKDNNGKVGVYCWFNNVNGKFYIGSGDPLYLRLSDYYQDWYYIARASIYIVRALSKHGMANFSLVILEYTTSDNLIKCEQKWIDLLNPEYNLNRLAGNSSGYVHTPESIEKMRTLALGRKHSEQVKKLMSESRKGVNNNFYGKKHTIESIDLIRTAALKRTKLNKPGIEVEITDLETKLTTTYESIRKAANAINSDIKSLSRREKSQLEKGINTPYRGRYMIVFKRS
jgi:group I intron endonuclease